MCGERAAALRASCALPSRGMADESIEAVVVRALDARAVVVGALCCSMYENAEHEELAQRDEHAAERESR